MESFFVKIGDGLIKFCLFFINLFISISNKKSINKSDIDKNKDNLNNPNNPNKSNSSNKFNKFNLNNLKSLFFNEDFQEELIFESLENKSSKSKNKKGFLSFLSSNNYNNYNNTKTTLSSNNINKLSNSQEKEGFSEFLNNKLLFNLKSLSKFGIYFIIIIFILIGLVGYFISFEIALIILISIVLVFLTIIYTPKMKMQNNSVYFSRELPYALRQLATELKSGKSLFNSLESVVQADYGVLSLEFSRVLEEIKYGETTEDAFIHLENRIKSDALSRVIREILSTLRIGGNLANSLSIIAEDINFEMRMKLKDYAQRLNAFIMIYTFIAILAPVVLLTLLLAASTVMGDFVPGDLLLILYGVFFPMLIIFLGFMIKKLEPKI
ncbi:MAG: type II secretion system F family protein [archaeon]|nr:type II secretion system F family protein [archaeon]